MAKQIGKYTVTFNAETKDFSSKVKGVEATVAKFSRRASQAKANTTGLSASFSTAANNASILLGPLNGVSGRLSSIAAGLTRINPLLLATGAAVSGTATILSKATLAASEYSKQMFRLNNY